MHQHHYKNLKFLIIYINTFFSSSRIIIRRIIEYIIMSIVKLYQPKVSQLRYLHIIPELGHNIKPGQTNITKIYI